MRIRSTDHSHHDLHGGAPLTVTVKTARGLLGVGNTTMWQLIKDHRVKTITIGRRRLVLFSSLERLVAASDES